MITLSQLYLPLQVHVLLSAGIITSWQVVDPAFKQLLLQHKQVPSLTCMALEELHKQGVRLKEPARALQQVLEDLAVEGFTAGTAGFDRLEGDDGGRLFKVSA